MVLVPRFYTYFLYSCNIKLSSEQHFHYFALLLIDDPTFADANLRVCIGFQKTASGNPVSLGCFSGSTLSLTKHCRQLTHSNINSNSPGWAQLGIIAVNVAAAYHDLDANECPSSHQQSMLLICMIHFRVKTVKMFVGFKQGSHLYTNRDPLIETPTVTTITVQVDL